jgi:hypothetical protein
VKRRYQKPKHASRRLSAAERRSRELSRGDRYRIGKELCGEEEGQDHLPALPYEDEGEGAALPGMRPA